MIQVDGNKREDRPARDIEGAISQLGGMLGDRLSRAQAVREHHGKDSSYHAARLPDAVAYAESDADVVEIVRICTAHHCPVIPFGAGTSLEGHIGALEGGVSLDLSRLNRIMAVSQENLTATVQAGVTRNQLNAHLRDMGLFFPVDPGADATIGGMVSTRASGTAAVKYGTMKGNVVSLNVVVSGGEVVRTATQAPKSAAGYDLTSLFTGAEGTLGVVTEVTVKLYPIPETVMAGRVVFPTLEAATNTVTLAMQSCVPMARIELINTRQIAIINQYSNTDFPEQPTLFLEFHGSKEDVERQIETFADIAAEYDGEDINFARLQEDRNALWQARHDAAHAVPAVCTGKDIVVTDVCVPIDALSACILETEADFGEAGFDAPIVGHVGDGNFHVILPFDNADPEERERVEMLIGRLARRAIRAGGSCTGEHGIGCGKMVYLEEELPTAIPLMRAIKAALDPDNIFNPGKIFNLSGN